MANCANCSSDALYVYQITADYGLNYCQRHLPSFLSRGPQPNLFAAPVEAPVVETPAKGKKSQAVAEPEDVVEDDAPNS
jgi:hypothetical protein